MVKVCTTCGNGVYDYSTEQLCCNGEIKEDNTACANWTQHSSCRVTSRGWNTFKRSGHQ